MFRLDVLTQTVPLVSHLSQSGVELQAWLCDVQSEIDALHADDTLNLEQIKVQQYNIRVITVN